MLISAGDLIGILETYKYWIIFPIAIFEGPIMIIISGFLVNMGILNGYVAYIVVVLADVLGDTLYYLVGRYWRKASWIKRVGKWVGYDESSEAFLEEHFRNHKYKTFFISKFAHGVGGSVQVASGIARFPYKEFLFISFLGTIPKALILIILGYYAGNYYERIDDYLHNIAFITIGAVIVVLFFVVSKKYKKKLLTEE